MNNYQIHIMFKNNILIKKFTYFPAWRSANAKYVTLQWRRTGWQWRGTGWQLSCTAASSVRSPPRKSFGKKRFIKKKILIQILALTNMFMSIYWRYYVVTKWIENFRSIFVKYVPLKPSQLSHFDWQVPPHLWQVCLIKNLARICITIVTLW